MWDVWGFSASGFGEWFWRVVLASGFGEWFWRMVLANGFGERIEPYMTSWALTCEVIIFGGGKCFYKYICLHFQLYLFYLLICANIFRHFLLY
jgi:hypothetical protein